MGKKIDLTGQTFGKLTVLEEAQERNKSGSVCWVCQCECGNIVTVSGDNLRRNHTKSCGCQRKESAQARVVNLTGQRFGMITVKKKAVNPYKNRHTYWLCDCDCGKTNILIDGENLKAGRTKSCGCNNYKKPEDLTGQKFGKLTPLYWFHKDNRVLWHCQCDCGNTIDVLTNVLKSGRTQSCDCINYSIGEKNIELLLKENNISYIKEFKFNDLGLYRFDFYLPEYHRLIEFDGKQHFQDCGGSWDKNDNLKQRQERDKIKNQYALDNNIDLIRIPYWERDNITIDYILGNKFLIKENC